MICDKIKLDDLRESDWTNIDKSSNLALLVFASNFNSDTILFGYPKHSEHTNWLHRHRWKVEGSSWLALHSLLPLWTSSDLFIVGFFQDLSYLNVSVSKCIFFDTHLLFYSTCWILLFHSSLSILLARRNLGNGDTRCSRLIGLPIHLGYRDGPVYNIRFGMCNKSAFQDNTRYMSCWMTWVHRYSMHWWRYDRLCMC